jgi:hypothetical protein
MAIRFVHDLQPDPQRSAAKPRNLHLSVAIDGEIVQITDDWFDDGLLGL